MKNEREALADTHKYLVEFTGTAGRFDNFRVFKTLVESKGGSLTGRDLTDLEIADRFLCGPASTIARAMEEGRSEMMRCTRGFKQRQVADVPGKTASVLGMGGGKVTQTSRLGAIADGIDAYLSKQDQGTEYREILRQFVFGLDPRELLCELKLASMYRAAIEELGLAADPESADGGRQAMPLDAGMFSSLEAIIRA